MIRMMMTTTTRLLLTLSLALTAGAALGLTAREARADVCFGGGHRPDIEQPDAHDAGTGDGSVLGLRRGHSTGRYAGAGLILTAGLGMVWLGGRRRDKDKGKGKQEIGGEAEALTTTGEDRRPPTERSP